MSNTPAHAMARIPSSRTPASIDPMPRRTLKRDVIVVGCSLATGLFLAWGFGLSSTKLAPAAQKPQVAQPTAVSSNNSVNVLRTTIREELARSGAAVPTQPRQIVAVNDGPDKASEETGEEEPTRETPPTPAQQKALTDLETRVDERLAAGVWRSRTRSAGARKRH